jgi:hypothetical protein
MKDLLQADQPLYLPKGSVRSLLAFATLGGFIAGYVPVDLAVMVLAFYFAGKVDSA